MSPDVKKINPNGVTAMALDVQYLTEFVASLDNAFMLEQNLDELQQTVALMQSDNHEEFFDISTRNKKYGRVDAMNGPILLEKYVTPIPELFPRGSMLTPPPSGSPIRLTTQAELMRRSLTSARASACGDLLRVQTCISAGQLWIVQMVTGANSR